MKDLSNGCKIRFNFFNGILEEAMGYVIKGDEEKVLKLKKALYGLKQAPRAWNSRIEN
jgi:hypothetical protein